MRKEVINILGQPSLFLQDLKGKEYPAYAEIRRNKRVNGQREITLSFLSNQINVDFIDKIEFGWKLLFKGEWYTIIAPAYQLDGDQTSVSVEAVLSFFVDLNGHYLQDEVEDKSFTPASFFSDLFTGTGYSFVLVDSLGANTLNYQRNQSKTERFLYAIDRFKGEYTIKGKVAYIYSLSGSDKDIILHDDLNIQDARVEVDASGFHTYAKGYGDLDESKEDADYELETEYLSPLADKYGKIEGPAIYDGSFKHESALHDAVKKQVENSYKVSTTITPVDLTNNGYPEMQLEEGDRVYLHIDRLDLNQQVRVIEIEESFDVEGNIIDVQYTLGNESIAKRYKTQQYDTLKDFQDIMNGDKKIETSWLDEAVKRAADIINGNLDSHFSYGPGEIIGINRSNPNEYMRFNTDGIGFSRDGGKTYESAITYEGIVANAINAGTLRGIFIEGVEIHGSIFLSRNSETEYTRIENAEITTRGQYTRTWFGETTTEDVGLQVRYGRLRFHNYDNQRNLYLFDKGITTYLGGSDSENGEDSSNYGSGTIEFFSYRHNNLIRGLTMYSNNGVVALESEQRNIVIAPRYTTRANGNKFSFDAKDVTNDGVIYFGNTAIRFKADTTGEPLIWATDASGDRASGSFYGRYLYGDLKPRGTFAYTIAPRLRVVMNDNKDTFGEVEASDFIQTSSREKKENIREFDKNATDILCGLDIVKFDYIEGDKDRIGVIAEDSPDIADDERETVSLGDTTFLHTKAIQELNDRLKKMEELA